MPSLSLPSSFLQGFGTGAGLIIAIGAQNAHVLRTGLRGQQVALTVTACIARLAGGRRDVVSRSNPRAHSPDYRSCSMNSIAKRITLQLLPDSYAIARLPSDSPIPDWADGTGFVTISRTQDELSITCLERRVPDGVQADRGWTALRFVGPFAFGETGIVLSVIRPLSENGIGVFVVSTFDGDHLLIQHADRERAWMLLTAAGHDLGAEGVVAA
jgi:uncharacterized protein